MTNPVTIARNTLAAIRQAYWGQRFSSLGSHSDIQPRANFEYASKIRAGHHCGFARQSLVRANTEDERGIRLGNHVSIMENVLVNANRGHVSIGNNSWLGAGTVVHGNGGVEIGNHVMIASHCAVNTISHHFDRTDIPMSEQGTYCDPVTIEDDVWIGTGAVILQGVRIGRGSIIAAGAVVNRSIPPYSIAMGVPARVTGSRKPQQDTEQAMNISNIQLQAGGRS